MTLERTTDTKLNEILDAYYVPDPEVNFHRRIRLNIEKQAVLIRRHKNVQLLIALAVAGVLAVGLFFLLPTGNPPLTPEERAQVEEGLNTGFNQLHSELKDLIKSDPKPGQTPAVKSEKKNNTGDLESGMDALKDVPRDWLKKKRINR